MFKSRDSSAASSLEAFTADLNQARDRLEKDREQCNKMQADIRDMDTALGRLDLAKSDLIEVTEGLDAECSRLGHLNDRRRGAIAAQRSELDELQKPRIEEEEAAGNAVQRAASERSAFSLSVCVLSAKILENIIDCSPTEIQRALQERTSQVEAAESRAETLRAELAMIRKGIEEEEAALSKEVTKNTISLIGTKRPREGADVDYGLENSTVVASPNADSNAALHSVSSLEEQLATLQEKLAFDRCTFAEEIKTLIERRDQLRQQLRNIDKDMSVADEAHEKAQQRLMSAMDNASCVTCKSCHGKVARDDIHSI